MVRIVVDGEGSRAVELCIRAALGDRANEEQCHQRGRRRAGW
jgi:hypothetical protein